MKGHTFEDSILLTGYIDGRLGTEFYYLGILAQQFDEKMTAKVMHWPISILHAFLSDDTPPVRTILIGEREITISQRKERYIQTYHTFCHRYGLYPQPKNNLEHSFISAMTMAALFGLPATGFAIQPQNEADACNPWDDALCRKRNALYNEYGINPLRCSVMEHDFIYAMTMVKDGKADYEFLYEEPSDSDSH